MDDLREGKRLQILGSLKDTPNLKRKFGPPRPKYKTDFEGVMKDELFEILSADREKLFTAEQHKEIWKKEEKVRDEERHMVEELEKQKEEEDAKKREALEELYANVTRQKIQEKIEEIKHIHHIELEAKKTEFLETHHINYPPKQRQSMAATTNKTDPSKESKSANPAEKGKGKKGQGQKGQSTRPNQGQRGSGPKPQQPRGSYPNEFLGELGDELDELSEPYGDGRASGQAKQSLRSSQDQRKSQGGRYSNASDNGARGSQEIPGEYEDAEWSDAEAFGYEKKFPYEKKASLKEEKELPPAVPSETEVIKEPVKVNQSNEDIQLSFKFPPVSTAALEQMEKGLLHVDTAATKLQLVLGKVTSRMVYVPRTPLNSAEKEGAEEGPTAGPYGYNGTSDLDCSVDSDSKPLTDPNAPKPPSRDVATQVRSRDITKAYTDLQQEEINQKKQEAADAEQEALLQKTMEEISDEEKVVVRKESKRADALILTRPAGYKPLELSLPIAALTSNAQTQVTDFLLDSQYALERGIVLSKYDILWPTVGEFNMEMAAKRVQDYIHQCWTLDPKWMFNVKPIQTFSDDNRKRFIFEAKFSVPTSLSPIPQSTASVFFIFEISHYAGREDPVKVHYVVEGTRFVHCPGLIPFQDKWLWTIISDKVRIQRSVTF